MGTIVNTQHAVNPTNGALNAHNEYCSFQVQLLRDPGQSLPRVVDTEFRKVGMVPCSTEILLLDEEQGSSMH